MVQSIIRSAKQPMVSVILPTYNRAEFLGEAISSVLDQSFKNFELLVIDDGSTDQTPQLVEKFSDPRLIYLSQSNKGRSAARNYGLSNASGSHIAFLDSDDVYLNSKLELQVDYMNEHPEFDMIYTSAYCIDRKGNQFDEQPYIAVSEGNIYKQVAFFRPLTITLPTVMLRREVLDAVGYFDESMERFEDTDLWRRIAKVFMVGAINEPTCLLRTHESNALVTQDPKNIIKAVDYYVAKIFQEDADVDRDFLRDGACGLYEYYAKALLSIPGWRSYGIYMLKNAFLLRPGRVLALSVGGVQAVIESFTRQ